jgi:hypothetical protein
MAYQTADYLKSKFEDGDFPDANDFGDLIDSCHNNSVSGDAIYFDNINNQNNTLIFKNIILKSPAGGKYRVFLTEEGVLSSYQIAPPDPNLIVLPPASATNITYPPSFYTNFSSITGLDDDLDGYTNEVELSAGTDPLNPLDFPISLFNVFNNV